MKRKIYTPPEVAATGLQETFERGMVASERSFFVRAKRKGARVFRGGWPDFLLADEVGLFAVECKRGFDTISQRQADMLEALELAGVLGYVWWDVRPDELIPWREYGHHLLAASPLAL